ncbi:MAG: tetratricopeptide repeat protein [Gammaproteobacteria bacterium]
MGQAVPDEGLSWLDRLKRHYIGRVVIPYAIVIGFVMQLAARVFPYFGWSGAVPALVIVLVASLPVVLVLTWLLARPKDRPEARAWQHQHRKLGTAVSLLVVILAGISGFFAWRFSVLHAQRLEQVATAPFAAKSIAVLPFENLSADKNNDYFVAGMQDLILTKLADIGDLKVIARTSTAKYASHPDDLKSVGRQLGVATILEGSVQKQGTQVLINVQLIDAATQTHLWAQDYTRTLDNVFGVEGEVAGKIAAALDAKLSSGEAARLAAVPTRNEAALDLFLRAEYKTHQAELGGGNPLILAAAIPLYRQAIEKDPGFALAYARLSYAESDLTYGGAGGQDAAQLNARARADAEQALKLAPELAAAQLALGYNDYWGRSDFDGALKAFAAALALRPNDPDALEGQGLAQRRVGLFDAAIASLGQAFTQNPRNAVLAKDIAGTYMGMGRYPDAERWSLRALTLAPDSIAAKEQYVDSLLLGSGDIARALAAAAGDSNRLKVGTRVPLLIYQRRYREALDLLDSVPVNVPDPFLAYVVIGKPQTKARLLRLLGEPERAKPLYEQVLPMLRTQLKMQQGIDVGIIWSRVAEAELGLGHAAAAMDALAKSQAIASNSNDHLSAPRLMQINAGLYAQAGRPDLAVPLLAKALASPGIGAYYSPVLLWIDPAWDPIRKDARFQALLEKYAKYKPAVIYETAPTTIAAPAATMQ